MGRPNKIKNHRLFLSQLGFFYVFIKKFHISQK